MVELNQTSYPRRPRFTFICERQQNTRWTVSKTSSEDALRRLPLQLVARCEGLQWLLLGQLILSGLQPLYRKVTTLVLWLFQAEVKWEANQFKNLLSNSTILALYEENCRQQGVVFPDLTPQARQGGSTDMGNISYIIPSIHPKFAIGTDAAAHTTEFCRASGDKQVRQIKSFCYREHQRTNNNSTSLTSCNI